MLMGKINDLAISDSNVNMNIVEKYGTYRLQSDKEITENGKHTADVGFNGLSSVNVNVQGGGSTTWYAYVNINNENDILYSNVENPIEDITTLYSTYGSIIIPSNYDIDSENGNILIYQRDEQGMWETITYARDATKDTSNLMQNLYIGTYDILNGESFSTYSPFIGYKNVEFDKNPTFTIFSKSSGSSYFPKYICVKSEDINNDNFDYESMMFEIDNLPTNEITWAVSANIAIIVRDNATYDSSTNQITIVSDPEGTGEELIAKYDNVNKYSSILYNNVCIYY